MRLLYRLRRRLFLWLKPKRLTVFMLPSFDSGSETSIYDADTGLGWGCAFLQWKEFEIIQESEDRISFRGRDCTKERSLLSRQSFDKTLQSRTSPDGDASTSEMTRDSDDTGYPRTLQTWATPDRRT